MDRVSAQATALLEEGRPLEAAELLAGNSRFGQAARLLLGHLGVAADGVASLPPGKRLHVEKAAAYLVRAQEEGEAAALYAALGDAARAAELHRAAEVRAAQPPSPQLAERLERQGRLEDAARAWLHLGERDAVARVARQLPPRTGAFYLGQIGRYFEAARLCLDAGDKQAAYECLVRVPSTDPDYNAACRHVVALVWSKRFLDERLAAFLRPWTESVPEQGDFDALCKLAVLFGENGRIDDAREVYRRIVQQAPDHGEAKTGLAILSGDGLEPAGVSGSAGGREVTQTARVFARVDKTGMEVVSEEHTHGIARGALARRVRALQADALVGGRYRLRKKVGGGGMGVVFEAFDEELGELVALKFLLPLEEDNALARFKREIALTRRLSHPNIVRVFDLGIHEDLRYVTMELLRGQDLAHRMKNGELDLATGLDVLAQACRGLDAAHKEGIVHRDVKPANIFVTERGPVKVMDFGVAREASEAAAGLTQAGVILGTPRYMPPEVFLGSRAIRPSMDIYALGVCAYELATGEPPFEDGHSMTLLKKKVNEDPVPPRTKNPDVPEVLDALILSLLAKLPEGRPATAGDAADAFERIVAWLAMNAPTRTDERARRE